MHQLIHNGIVVPEPPAPLGLTLDIRGQKVHLNPRQEEMALAWARKRGTPYVEDPVFQANFIRDFKVALGIDTPVELAEIDFQAYVHLINQERYRQTHMSDEKRRALAKERKAQREALKTLFGYAIVDGQRVELGNYMAEPSGLFMGRGQHPLRGRWKQGAFKEDITLNLSPDASCPEGNWKEIVWQPDSLWVARWDDKLSGKTKYVWLADTTPVKQSREESKFDKARKLQAEIDAVRAAIQEGLASEHPRTRMVATVCYLIDTLCLRVGDEKDPDEADTVGATTLRPEHVKFMANGKVEFRFLGKDSVEWRKKISLPAMVRASLEELVQQARPSNSGSGAARDLPQIFPDVGSEHVNRYLSGILPGLSAKVFRTYRATSAVSDSLEHSGTKETSPEYVKWQAVAEANLRAAELCNHTKKAGVNWSTAERAYQARLAKAQDRWQASGQTLEQAQKEHALLRSQSQQLMSESTDENIKKLQALRTKAVRAKARLVQLSERKERAEAAVGKIKAQMTVAKQKRTWNLGTSLKSYIDPRVYQHWGDQVQYDVLAHYYPTILQRKFAWVRLAVTSVTRSANQIVLVRTCLRADIPKVADIFNQLAIEQPECTLPLTHDDIAQQYLPSLDKPWREAIAAYDENGDVLGFAVLGPERMEDKQYLLDVFGVLRPGEKSPAAADSLAEEIQHRLHIFQAQYPKREYTLQPVEENWHLCAPDLAKALGLAPESEEVEASSEDLERELEQGMA